MSVMGIMFWGNQRQLGAGLRIIAFKVVWQFAVFSLKITLGTLCDHPGLRWDSSHCQKSELRPSTVQVLNHLFPWGFETHYIPFPWALGCLVVPSDPAFVCHGFLRVFLMVCLEAQILQDFKSCLGVPTFICARWWDEWWRSHRTGRLDISDW